MGQKLNQTSKEAYLKRISSISADSTPKWGALTPVALMAHLRRSFEISLGLLEVEDRSKPVLRTIMRILFFRIFTKWPEAKIKAPKIFFPQTDELAFEDEKKRVIELLKNFVETSEANPKQKELSPLLGLLPLSEWQYIHGAHLEHHLRQFAAE